ncbi:MAG: DUF3805 domain-containing protein [Phocaeicola sp.]
MKYIAPGGWFSLEYPEGWHEFEDSEESFLFYNPNHWAGNFRISAFRGEQKSYGKECIAYELKQNKKATLVKVGKWDAAYALQTFVEEGTAYSSHFWVVGCDDLSIECSFTVAKDEPFAVAKQMIESIELRHPSSKTAREIIPIRVIEIGEINLAFDWASTTLKKLLAKDFTSSEQDLDRIQQVMQSGTFKPQQRETWERFGILFGTILINEMEGMQWVTAIDGKMEYPALRFMESDLIIAPSQWVWNQMKSGAPCNLRKEFDRIKHEATLLLEKQK